MLGGRKKQVKILDKLWEALLACCHSSQVIHTHTHKFQYTAWICPSQLLIAWTISKIVKCLLFWHYHFPQSFPFFLFGINLSPLTITICRSSVSSVHLSIRLRNYLLSVNRMISGLHFTIMG